MAQPESKFYILRYAFSSNRSLPALRTAFSKGLRITNLTVDDSPVLIWGQSQVGQVDEKEFEIKVWAEVFGPPGSIMLWSGVSESMYLSPSKSEFIGAYPPSEKAVWLSTMGDEELVGA